MKEIEVYDPPMCCSTGLCGPDVDPVLLRFARDLRWLEEQGVTVRRFNLSQSPSAFVENETVRALLTKSGEKALPLLVVAKQVVSAGAYPERDALAAFLGLPGIAQTAPVAAPSSCCCGGKC